MKTPDSRLPSQQPRRLIITPADIKIITGCSDSTASRRLSLVKQALGRLERQQVTIKEYCDYFGLDELEVRHALQIA